MAITAVVDEEDDVGAILLVDVLYFGHKTIKRIKNP